MACLNFTLYLDSSFPRSLWTNDIRNLTKLCQQYAGSHFSIEIIHLANERQRAFHDGVVTTPTVLLEAESGRKQILGSMDETERFLKLLQHPACETRRESRLRTLLADLKPLTPKLSRVVRSS